jgi:hypothetical protein
VNWRLMLTGIVTACVATVAAPAHARQIADPDDSPGMLDIAVVAHKLESQAHGVDLRRQVTLRMKTYDRWGSPVLRSNQIELQLRRRPHADSQRVVLIHMRHGRLRATISTPRGVVGHADVGRPNARSVVVRATRAKLFGRHVRDPEYHWVTRYNSGRPGDDQCGMPSDVAIICYDENERWIRLSS